MVIPKKAGLVAIGIILALVFMSYAGVLTITGLGAVPIMADNIKAGEIQFMSTTLADATFPENQALDFTFDSKMTATTHDTYIHSIQLTKIIVYWPSTAGPMQINVVLPTTTSVTSTVSPGYSSFTSAASIPSTHAIGTIYPEIWYTFSAYRRTSDTSYTEYTGIQVKVAAGDITFGQVGTSDPGGAIGYLTVYTSVDNVAVTITGPTTGLMFSVSGIVTWDNLPIGTYSIKLDRDGYDSQYLSAVVTENKETIVDHKIWVQSATIPGEGTGGTGGDGDEYAWSTYGYLAAIGGIIIGVMVFAFAPIPPKFKAFIALAIALAGLVAAHMFNIGG